jgi:RNA polymerase sigma-70 factor (ECF subfamily)
MVFNLCLQYVQNTEDAEEICQDVFVKIYEALPKFQQAAAHSTWIYRIAINTSLDFIKKKKRKKRFALITSLFQDNNQPKFEEASFDHPGILLENKEGLKNIFSKMNSLPANQQTALILNKIERKSHAEIADIMLISVKAAESLVQRAKTNLLQKLQPNEGKAGNDRLTK